MNAIVLDTEWGYRDGRRDAETAFEPVILCARELSSGKEHSFRGRGDRLLSFVDDHRDHIWVAHSATAEMKYLLRLGIELPPHWFCTMTAYRNVHNRPGYLDGSLVTALLKMGLAEFVPIDKEVIREKILNLNFVDADFPQIEKYCFSDVAATAALYEKLVDKVNPVAMAYWADYLKAVARMELRGIPIDSLMLRTILANRSHIAQAMMDRINATYPMFRRNGSFSSKAFFKWIKQQGIRWPQKRSLGSGKIYFPLDDDTMEAMETRHPFIAELRQVRKSLRTFGKFGFKVDGGNDRHFFSTMPFRTVTGRNQPSKFIFAGPKWLRWLILPSDPDHVLIYIDYTSQEIGIAAALSGDPAMQKMYAAPDPHMAFAEMSKAVPLGATKAEYPKERKAHKTVNLGVLYQQTEYGISERLGIEIEEAKKILIQHRNLFHVFHAWSERIISSSFDRGYAITRCGWRATVPPDSKFRTWGNFPIQAAGADAMRVMTIALDRQHVQILAIVHDGWLLSCRRDQVEQLRQAVEHARVFTNKTVLNGFPLRLDWTEYGNRFEDEDGQPAWGFIQSVLPKEPLYVPPE